MFACDLLEAHDRIRTKHFCNLHFTIAVAALIVCVQLLQRPLLILHADYYCAIFTAKIIADARFVVSFSIDRRPHSLLVQFIASTTRLSMFLSSFSTIFSS